MYGRTYVLDPTCRLMAARGDLPRGRYCALLGRFLSRSELLEKLREYVARAGEGVNADYEAALRGRP